MTSEGQDRLAITRQRQQLRRSGFHPIPVNGKAPSGVMGWQTKTNSNDAEIAGWVDPGFFPDHLNTGILTFDTPAIDSDIDDPDAAAAVEQLIRDAFEEHGTVLTRFGREPRRAVLFRTDTPFKKLVLNLVAPSGKPQKIEIMGNGQQLVVHGIHPDTHAPYRWYGGEPGEVPRHALPLLNEADARDMLFRFAELLCKEHGYALPDAPRQVRADGNGSTDWGYFLDNLIDHDADRDFEISLLRAGMSDGAVVNLMRAWVSRIVDTDPQRKQRRLDEIPRSVAGARRRLNATASDTHDNVVPMAARRGVNDHLRDVAHTVMARGAHGTEAAALQHDPRPEPPSQSEPAPVATPLPFIDKSNWDNVLPPQQRWAVPNRIPIGYVTLFSGAGAAGKSTIGLHLAAAQVLGREWLGALLEPRPAMFIDAEDHEDPIHRHLYAIIQHYGCKFSDLDDLHLTTLAGQDAVLAISVNGKMEPTPRFHQVLRAAQQIQPGVIVICSSANVFAGNEIDRSQVMQFIGLLQRIAAAGNSAVVLVSHPSLTGQSSGSGISGSTQWFNGPRAHMYLQGVEAEGEEKKDHDLRLLEFKKNQYGPITDAITLRYKDGMFLPHGTVGGFDAMRRDSDAEVAVITLLVRFTQEGRSVSHKRRANNWVAGEFHSQPEAQAKKLTKAEIAEAVERLFAAGQLRVEPYGKPSKGWERIVLI